MKNLLKSGIWISPLILLAGTEVSAQNVYRVNQKSQWEGWKFPKGAIELRDDGTITPVRFEQPFNAAPSAPRFIHKLKQGEVQGGVRRVGSNPAAARNIIDGDLRTFWKPDPADPLDEWWLEIDLGRAVAVKEIRLHFPDQEGARPLRQFRVFASDGKRQSQTEDVFAFQLVGGTTKWNEQTLLTYPVAVGERTKVVLRLGEGGAGTDTSTAFAPLQYVRIIIDAQSPDAALSEVEVISFGDNIAPGTLERGGFIDDQGKGRTGGIADGDVNTFWEELNWDDSTGEKAQWNWDLGAVYWINRVVFAAFQETTTWGRPRILRHRLLGSDGSLKPSGGIDFDLLFDFADPREWTNPEPLIYLFYPYRPLRNLYILFAGSSSGAIAEAFIFPVGYVAQVELNSDFIEVSSRPKVLQALRWEADIPPGTRVQAQTRSGNTLVERTVYHHRNGTEVTKEKYESLIKSLKGQIDTFIEPGEDWSGWSNVYQFSEQAFLSPSPRRYVQFRVLLSSDSPETAPTLRSFSLDYTEAFLAGAVGQIYPKEARPGVMERFSYHLQPQFSSGDPGFDRLLIETPSQAGADSLFVRIGGVQVEPKGVRISPDSLVLELPQVVRRDSVVVDFRANVMASPYLFRASVGKVQQPGLWQLADPAERFATTVFLPEVLAAGQFIANLPDEPLVITPNGDGVRDQAEIRFAVLKVESPPQVRIYGLDGRLIQELTGSRDPDRFWRYAWSGRDLNGALVPPGVYLYQVNLEAQTGTEALTRIISVAY